jgi:hypothetical protein
MRTYQFDTGHPLVDCQFVLARKVMEMLYQACRELTNARSSFWACGIDDGLCEVWVELVCFAAIGRGAIRSHIVLGICEYIRVKLKHC